MSYRVSTCFKPPFGRGCWRKTMVGLLVGCSGSKVGQSHRLIGGFAYVQVVPPCSSSPSYEMECVFIVYRRKFRSQTSDMDRWKSRGGKGQGGEEKRWEDQRRERVRRKKMQVCEKVGKSRLTVFFQWFGAPEGRKVTSLKRRVRSQLARWEIRTCTPLWREAHFQVKMYKAHHVRTSFGSWDVEKVHAVVARNTFPSKNVQNTLGSDHFWKLKCSKSARGCGAKHISKSKV